MAVQLDNLQSKSGVQNTNHAQAQANQLRWITNEVC